MQQRDSLSYTIRVAVVLCVVCSLAVSAAAVILKPYQDANRAAEQQARMNLLSHNQRAQQKHRDNQYFNCHRIHEYNPIPNALPRNKKHRPC